MAQSQDPLDLHEIATLLNYERASREPRFRHAKLYDIADPLGRFTSLIPFPKKFWGSDPDTVRRGFAFQPVPPTSSYEKDAPDLPSNMVMPGNRLATLPQTELEQIYWEARGQDSCYASINLFQHFFDMFPGRTPLLVRTACGEDFVTAVDQRRIFQYDFYEPNQVTLSAMKPATLYITGNDDVAPHAVLAFLNGRTRVILDLSSMQFGPLGRGAGGEFFQLERYHEWSVFARAVVKDINTVEINVNRIGPHPLWDDHLKECAERVKSRWDNRDKEHWCSQCGSPGATSCCPCKQVWYCSRAHQKQAWKYHKTFCATRHMEK